MKILSEVMETFSMWIVAMVVQLCNLLKIIELYAENR